jgi:lysyl-tRNA synthetase class II
MIRMSVILAAALLSAGAPRAAEPVNDYPTAVRADYVFACMQVNGQTREALEKCSCSIDVIASLLPYDQYEEAETIMRVRQRGGEKAAIFLTNPTLRGKVDDLRRAQVEGELRCF